VQEKAIFLDFIFTSIFRATDYLSTITLFTVKPAIIAFRRIGYVFIFIKKKSIAGYFSYF